MTNTVDTLVLDLLEWLGTDRRPCIEVMRAWRTSCPRLPVWEEANERGFVHVLQHASERGSFVAVSAQGAAHLRQRPPENEATRFDTAASRTH